MPTRDECKRILSKLGFKHGVSPNIISTHLLSKDDKNDMLNGQISIDELDCHIKIWVKNGCPDYCVSERAPEKPPQRLVAPFVEWPVS